MEIYYNILRFRDVVTSYNYIIAEKTFIGNNPRHKLLGGEK